MPTRVPPQVQRSDDGRVTTIRVPAASSPNRTDRVPTRFTEPRTDTIRSNERTAAPRALVGTPGGTGINPQSIRVPASTDRSRSLLVPTRFVDNDTGRTFTRPGTDNRLTLPTASQLVGRDMTAGHSTLSQRPAGLLGRSTAQLGARGYAPRPYGSLYRPYYSQSHFLGYRSNTGRVHVNIGGCQPYLGSYYGPRPGYYFYGGRYHSRPFCGSYYHPRRSWYVGIGFGFYHAYPVYPVYPVYSHVYYTTPVVYSTATYVQPAYVAVQPAQQVIYTDDAPAFGTATGTMAEPPMYVGLNDPAQPAADTSMIDDEAAKAQAAAIEKLDNLMRTGVEAFSSGRYEQAGQKFLEAAIEAPDMVDALLAYAVARFATGDYDASAVAIRRGIRAEPGVVDSLFDIRDRYGKLSDFNEHYGRLQQFVEVNPSDIDARVVLGFVEHFTGQRERSAKTFEAVKLQSPADLELADTFLGAKPMSELLGPPMSPDSEGNTAPRSSDLPASSADAAIDADAESKIEFAPLLDPSDQGGNNLDKMDRALIRIGDHSFEVWLAQSAEEQERGLMHVSEEWLAPIRDYSGQGLPDIHRGMFFVFGQERMRSFWMKDTPVALDVAFIDAEGRIVNIETMDPLATQHYGSKAAAAYALEVPAGLMERLSIRPGDRVEVPAELR